MRFVPYTRTPEHDAQLLKLWLRLQETAELEKTFGRGSWALSAFLATLTHAANALYLCRDNDRIIAAVLVNPVMSGAFITVWIDPVWRKARCSEKRRTLIEALEYVYEAAFEQFPVLLGATKQPKLAKVHQSWGYRILGTIPHLFDHRDAMIVVLTPDDFAEARTRRHARWVRKVAQARSTT